ncbi:hypothetical protein [Listeria booriae]|uniref:hypothetical protein n=1 Tax=Listeria booriae TaxID=1552123 RepID=UPI0016292FC8|nr:hypothetical protein [Listeria booriae]MBC2067876.1 hypothetical protein [Listeria booriae]
MKPKYAENIIVGVVLKNKFQWYVSERDVWILDIDKYSEAYRKNGYAFDMNFALQFRDNIHIVDTKMAENYLAGYHEDIVESDDLQNQLLDRQYEDTVLALQPSLYVNFDDRIFISAYPELLPFEEYAPTGWNSRYGTIEEYIPERERYWIIDGEDIIAEKYKVEMRGEKE